jgi:hypothetical protein
MSRRTFTICLFFLACGGTTSLFANETAEKSENKPNFVIILTDDQGWNALRTQVDPDIPESGSNYYRTPNAARV